MGVFTSDRLRITHRWDESWIDGSSKDFIPALLILCLEPREKKQLWLDQTMDDTAPAASPWRILAQPKLCATEELERPPLNWRRWCIPYVNLLRNHTSVRTVWIREQWKPNIYQQPLIRHQKQTTRKNGLSGDQFFSINLWIVSYLNVLDRQEWPARKGNGGV